MNVWSSLVRHLVARGRKEEKKMGVRRQAPRGEKKLWSNG